MATHIITVRDFDEYQELAVKLKAEGKNPLVIDMTGNCNDIVIISGDIKIGHFASKVFYKKVLNQIEERLSQYSHTDDVVEDGTLGKMIEQLVAIRADLDS